MSRGIEGPGGSPSGFSSPVARPASESLEGSYRGSKIAALDHNSLVQDSLEELPAHQSERVSKKLAQRKANTRGGSRIQEIVDKYLRTVPGAPGAQELKQLLARLKQFAGSSPQQAAAELKQLLQERRGDSLGGGDAALLIALEEALAAESGNETLLSAVRSVRTELGTQLQEFCHDQPKFFEGLGEVYRKLASEHGDQGFLSSCELLLQRHGSEVQAQGRTMDSQQLKARLDCLYWVEVARNAYLSFTTLLEKLDGLSAA